MTQRKQIRNFWRKMSACVALGGILACAVAQQPDLTVLRVLPAPSDPFTLRVSGRVDVVVQNIGTVASTPCSVVVFTDMNANAQYDAGTDILLGTGSVPAIGANLSATVSVSVLGRVLFWDGWISAYVDYGNAVAESDERNNYGNTGSVCGGSVRMGVLNPRLKVALGCGQSEQSATRAVLQHPTVEWKWHTGICRLVLFSQQFSSGCGFRWCDGGGCWSDGLQR
jgi:hypothetical protein